MDMLREKVPCRRTVGFESFSFLGGGDPSVNNGRLQSATRQEKKMVPTFNRISPKEEQEHFQEDKMLY